MKINLHTHQKSKRLDVVDIVNQYPQERDASASFFSVGIHPWHIEEAVLEKEYELVFQYAQEATALAVGECGLDKRIATPLVVQQRVFERQLRIAQELQKPVIVHCVAAYDEVMQLVKQEKITVPIVFHGFSKNHQLAQQLVKAGCYLSFGKTLLKDPTRATALLGTPLEHLFLETDSSDYTIEEVYNKAASLLSLPLEELEEQLIKNTQNLFGFSEPLQNRLR